ncbi:MAG TPA: DUF3866 family protein [Oscillospiraceae bacterium]|nr:DUF3866 family protein [Oscillospiraceae bacterium]
MFSRHAAVVQAVESQSAQYEVLAVKWGATTGQAINYLPLTGAAAPGDQVLINTMAVELQLGSGGYHFVLANLASPEHTSQGAGHIMKLRYTPQQVRVLAVEEEASPQHALMAEAESLVGMPVIAGELHSMLAPFCIALKAKKPALRLAYLMTDGGALPAFFSNTLRILKERELLCGVITAGQAFGGDWEAINIYSGLLAAKHVLAADVTVVCMGPGVAGTATRYGFSGMEVADNLNRAASLKGQPIALPRLSFADRRPRHQGFSHHTLTALTKATLVPVDLPLPMLAAAENKLLEQQIASSGLASKHRIFRYEGLSLASLADDQPLCRTMGRTLTDDPAFFLAAVATAQHVSLLIEP